MAHVVMVMVDGALLPTEPHGEHAFRYTAPGDDGPRRVDGTFVDDRYLPADKPTLLKEGDSFDVTEDDVVYHLERVRPLERDAATGLQDVCPLEWPEAWDPAEPLVVCAPTLMLDPPETPGAWHRRTYVDRTPDSCHPTPGYERDLVASLRGQRMLLRGCRPAGVTDKGHLVLRFLSASDPDAPRRRRR